MERNYDKSQEWWNSLPMYNMDKPCKRVLAARYYQTEQSFLTNVQIEMIFINECQQPNNDEVKKKYSSVIADIYAEHHVSPFTDIEKHNEGIIKAMVDFAIFYKENS